LCYLKLSTDLINVIAINFLKNSYLIQLKTMVHPAKNKQMSRGKILHEKQGLIVLVQRHFTHDLIHLLMLVIDQARPIQHDLMI